MGLLALGIGSMYAQFSGDPIQLFGDAELFFERASTGSLAGLDGGQIREITSGRLAIWIWQAVYDTFDAMGFQSDRYIGILVNNCVVALSAVMALHSARFIFGDDHERLKRLSLLFSCCGLFWLFSALFLRDSFVLALMTGIICAWIWYLKSPSLGVRLLVPGAATVLGVLTLPMLREQWTFLPIGFAGAATLSIMLRGDMRSSLGGVMATFFAGAVGIAMGAAFVVTFSDEAIRRLLEGQALYREFSAATHGDVSLGMSMIVNQPFPIRAVVGTIYIFVFPIPFWVGFQFETAYTLFSSINALFSYAITPLLIMAARFLWRNQRSRTPQLLFLVFNAVGLPMLVALTSLEIRHFGAVLVPILILALVPDWTQRSVKRRYQIILYITLGGVFAVHTAWVLVKL